MEAWQEADRAAAAMHDEDAHDGLAVSQGAHKEEEVQVYESFITFMLTNRQLLTLASIHTMLQMMVTSGSDHKYNKTPQQLSVFLQQLCEQEKIECGPDGMYKLLKKDK
jgi:anaphase-promoting complex subunit 2